MSRLFSELKEILYKEEIQKKGSYSAKDYVNLVVPSKSVKLKSLLEFWYTGDSLLKGDFVTNKTLHKYRFIKTANLSEDRFLLNYDTVELCKPVGKVNLRDEDILLAKDGGANGLGEACMYLSDNDSEGDYICGEILGLRCKDGVDKYYVLAVLKSKYFKEYLNAVTPEGSTLRHSKLLALEFDLPLSKWKEKMEYISYQTQIIIKMEKELKNKIACINSLFETELKIKEKSNYTYYPKISEIKEVGRMDTGAYLSEYVHLTNIIKSYKGGYEYILKENMTPGRTPKDYIYTNKKNKNVVLWITPKNLSPMELDFETYIHTEEHNNIKSNSIVISGIRYLGNGFYIEEGIDALCNQNTIIINHSDKKSKQIYLLAFLCSLIGKKMLMAWRVDGMVPIIYRDDISKIPIPKLDSEIEKKIVKLYYNKDDLTLSNTENMEEQIKNMGIYQLNMQILELKQKVEFKIYDIVRE